MKTLTANALTEIAKQFGSEPVTLVEIEWDTNATVVYADKTVNAQIQAKILQMAPVENALNNNNFTTHSVTVVLDDTDGVIKELLERIDVHKKRCTIYQWYGDLSLDDRFVVFVGQISTPFRWGEADRQLAFNVTSEVESFEVGFSPEEGQLDFVSDDLEGQPWPLVFGDVLHVPATKVRQIEHATMLDRFGLVDPLLWFKLKQIGQAYQQEAFMFTYWQLLREGTHKVAPPVWWTLREYVKVIIKEDLEQRDMKVIAKELEAQQGRAAKSPHDRFIRAAISQANADILTVSADMRQTAARKEWLEKVIALTEWAWKLEKKCALAMLKSVDELRRLSSMYFHTVQEICNQREAYDTTIRVQNVDAFDHGAPEEPYTWDPDDPENEAIPTSTTDVCINRVRFRVFFDHNRETMSFVAGPLNTHESIPIDPWQADDEPCHDITALDGLNLIWLQEDPPPNLEGMYLLVKKRGTDPDGNFRHIVKVERQIGRKVYYQLVEWDKGNPDNAVRGQSLEYTIRQIVDPPGGWVSLGPYGTQVPRGLFTGELDPNVWLREETALLLGIIRNFIPNGVSKEELTNLTKLVYLLQFDRLQTLAITAPGPRSIFTIIGEDVEEVIAASGLIPMQWLENWEVPYEELPDKLPFQVSSGTRIASCDDQCEIYIANLLPSTVKGVYAYRKDLYGSRYLAPVPSGYYIKDESKNLGTYDVVSLTFPRALSTIPGESWEDAVYVTMDSSVGPNVPDILEWLIETYTDKTVDATSFNAVRAQVRDGSNNELYPANFAILARPNVLAEITRIAWEARMALTLVGDVFYLKYLSARPSSVATVTEADILDESLQVVYTETSQLMTRIVATYVTDYLPLEPDEKPKRVVLRHNVKKYGLHSRNEIFHIYTNRDLVEKSATFWLIRQANTWKTIEFAVAKPHITLDPLDAVTVDLSQAHFVEDGDPTLCLLDSVLLDTENNRIVVRAQTGIKTGESEQYAFYWPALETPAEWPLDVEIAKGFAGGYGPGSGVSGTIDDCPS